MNMEHWWNGTDRGKQKRNARIKSCSNANMSTTNPTQTGVGLNRHFQVGKLAFNRLRQGMALKERDRLHVMRRSCKSRIPGRGVFVIGISSRRL